MSTTDTPNSCPHCGANPWDSGDTGYKCGSDYIQEETETPIIYRSSFCYSNENNQLKAEVEMLRKLSEMALESEEYAVEEWDEMKAEIKEIRVALGDDGRRTHKEILELAAKASQWRTWKQKYIDLNNAHIAEGQDPAGTIWEHAEKLQEELAKSKAEVERLKFKLMEAKDMMDCQSATIRRLGTGFHNDK